MCDVCSVFVEVDWFHSFFLCLSFCFFVSHHKNRLFRWNPIIRSYLSLFGLHVQTTHFSSKFFVQNCMLLIYFRYFFLSRSLLAVHFHMAHFFFVRIKIAVIEFQHTDRPTDSCAANFLFRSFMLLFFFLSRHFRWNEIRCKLL